MGTRQRGLNVIEACKGCLVGVITSGVGIDHHREGAAQAVKDQHLLRQHEQNIGHTQFIGWAGIHQLGFGIAHRVVTKVSDEPAMKHWKLWRGSAHKLLLVALDLLQRICHVAAFNALARLKQAQSIPFNG